MNTAATPERFNLYTGIHKALRSFFCDTLSRLGRLDVKDTAEMHATLGQVQALLDVLVGHLTHENDFLHTALEARAPGSASRTAGDHVEHVHQIEQLRSQVDALLAADAASRDALALRLYRDVALCFADNLQHMHVEETENAAALWSRYSDVELLGIHDRLLASLAPAEMLDSLRWMIPSATPFERTCMVKDMQEKMPPEALLGVLAHVRPHLDPTGWEKLSRTVRLAQAEPA